MSSRARFQPTLPAPAMITYMDGTSSAAYGSGSEHHLGCLVDGHLGRADGDQPLFAVPRCAGRVRHAHHDPGHLEATLSDLSDHQIGVITTGRGHKHIG